MKAWITAIGVFIAAAVLYFAPALTGDTLPQHDTIQYGGMRADIAAERDATGQDPQWTGGMFGGMPAYLIDVQWPAQAVKGTVGQVVKVIGTPVSFLFFAMLLFWVMLLMLGVNPWVGIVPALAWGLSTYTLLIIGAGHITKVWALIYAPPMLGAAWMALRRPSPWWGVALFGLFASLELGANHPQITYYFVLVLAALWLSEGWFSRFAKSFWKRTLLLFVASIFAVGSNFAPLWYTYKYSPETIRGGSELATARGLEVDYATAWSYGRAESWTMLIPRFMGGASSESLPPDGQTASSLRPYGLANAVAQMPSYWGDQPYTAGPTYLGAAVVFLAVLGLFLVGRRERWWVVAVGVFALFLAWGNHFMPFTEAMMRWLPGYNKFRTVSMALVVLQWAAPLLSAWALMALWQGVSRERLRKALYWSAGLVGGFCLFFALAGGLFFDFGQAFEAQTLTQMGMPDELARATADAMARDRAAILNADAWRSLAMVILTAAGVWFFMRGKLKRAWMLTIVGAVVVLDLAGVDTRYLGYKNFGPAEADRVTMTAADREILRDTTLAYRVLNLTVSPFNDATTSYFHRSVGGYHGAKLARYQDLIDRGMPQPVLDMLNTKYLIAGDSVVERPSALGAAWVVRDIQAVGSAREEIDTLTTVDLSRVAVVDTTCFDETARGGDSLAHVQIEEYRPAYLKYRYAATAPTTVVFSEIYYKDGWSAYVDGTKTPYFRADYVLRAMRLPVGEHTIEWRFRAPRFALVEGVTLAFSLLVLLGVAAAAWFNFRRK